MMFVAVDGAAVLKRPYKKRCNNDSNDSHEKTCVGFSPFKTRKRKTLHRLSNNLCFSNSFNSCFLYFLSRHKNMVQECMEYSKALIRIQISVKMNKLSGCSSVG